MDYQFIPKFLDGKIIDNILQTGKSINFLLKCCNVSDWMLELKTIDIEREIVSSSTLDSIRQWVIDCADITSKKLI